MAIVPLVKVTLYGPMTEKEGVLDSLQQLGCAHLINLTPGTRPGLPERGYSEETYQALKYLRSCPIQRRPARAAHDVHYEDIDQKILELARRQQALEDERDELKDQEAQLELWGDFILPASEELGEFQLWFYRLQHHQLDTLRETGLVWQSIASDARFQYVVVVSRERPTNVPSQPLELDPRGLAGVRARVAEIEEELDDMLWRRAEMTRWTELLENNLNVADDAAARRHAGKHTFDADQLFAVAAWVTVKDVAAVEHLAQRHGLALTIAPPEALDIPPTKLDNPAPLRGGESAVMFYMTPEYRSWDPSIILFFSFALFFGMIMSDAGYGLLLGVLLMSSWRRFGSSPEARKVRTLAVAVTISAIAYGVMIGSYFGWQPGPDSPLAKLMVPWLNPADQATAMSISILIGASHLTLANLVMARRFGFSFRALAPLGWCSMILGGLFAGFGWQQLFDPQGELVRLDVTLLVSGAVAVVLFSSARPMSLVPMAVLLRLVDGVKSLVGVSQAFGDVLSYLRLFALGLASAQLAVTFNDLARGVVNYPGLGVLMAAGIIFLGHGLNFVLAVMSGVVHGLRLNFIEFFNWCLQEEGYAFRPFAKKAGV